MKKTMRINARYVLAAILSIMLLTALVGFAAIHRCQRNRRQQR